MASLNGRHRPAYAFDSTIAEPQPCAVDDVVSICDTDPTRLAQALRLRWQRDGIGSCREAAEQSGWTVTIFEFNAQGGGLSAMLLPERTGGFTMAIDPWPTPDEERQQLTRAQVIEWRIAHEIGHTFFYGVALKGGPTRREPAGPSEERFCDEFATALTGVQTSSITAEAA